MRAAVLCLFLGLVAAGPMKNLQQSGKHNFDVKQRLVLELLDRIHDHSPHPEVSEAGNSYNPLDHEDQYENFPKVQKFLKHHTAGHHRPQHVHFNLFHPIHRREAVTLFEIFMGCHDFDTFFKTAAWAREHVNEGVFTYAFMVAVLNRPDMDGVHLPPMYEINPHYFTTTDVVQAAYSAKMKQTPAVIDMDFTGTPVNPEQWVAYFGEDVGLNSHHFHWHADFPFWWKEEYPIKKDRKGELFFYAHHQLTNRFDQERLSNYLPRVEPLHWNEPITEGFMPHATYKTEGEFPFRPDNMHFHDLPFLTVNEMEAMEHRVKEAIDLGYVIDTHGDFHQLNNTNGINLLGEIIESSHDSKNEKYYGSLHNFAHVMLSRVSDPQFKYGLPAGVMEHFETATRDPSFFRLHKYMDNIFKSHKYSLAPYSDDELDFPGVEVTKVEVTSGGHTNELTTFFDSFEFDLANAIDTSEHVDEVDIKARVKRLNHEDFAYNFDIESKKGHQAVVRVFLAPTTTYYGEPMEYNEKNWMMVELDRFTTKLNKGTNHIHRESKQSSATIPDRLGFKQLKAALESGSLHYEAKKRHCGHPERMLIPKGKSHGMKFTLAVVVTDFEHDQAFPHDHEYNIGNSLSYCGALNEHIPDGKPMGFPFDRQVEYIEDFLSHDNIKFQDITITHRE